MQEREKIKELFQRYHRGLCTPEEERRLHAWLNHYARSEADGIHKLSMKDTMRPVHARGGWLRWLPYAAAAIAAIFAIVRGIESELQTADHLTDAAHIVDDIAPGRNRATLTMDDGRTIPLSEAQSAIVVKNGEIAYQKSGEELARIENGISVPIRLATPKGGTYQIVLSDGTMVWLNAESSVTYPTRFAAEERVVEIEGEAYLSVAHDENRPFRVISDGQVVEVLGTEFNISSYKGDLETQTTLVEGRVRLVSSSARNSLLLEPGEQSLLSHAGMRKHRVNVSRFVAWKDGNFFFDETPLSDMMKQIERWYDVEVIYEREVPNELFSGTMSRNVTLRTVLELLRISEIKHRLENHQLIIE